MTLLGSSALLAAEPLRCPVCPPPNLASDARVIGEPIGASVCLPAHRRVLEQGTDTLTQLRDEAPILLTILLSSPEQGTHLLYLSQLPIRRRKALNRYATASPTRKGIN